MKRGLDMSEKLRTDLDHFDAAEISLQTLMANSLSFKLLLNHIHQPNVGLTNEVMILLEEISESIEKNVRLVVGFLDAVQITE